MALDKFAVSKETLFITFMTKANLAGDLQHSLAADYPSAKQLAPQGFVFDDLFPVGKVYHNVDPIAVPFLCNTICTEVAANSRRAAGNIVLINKSGPLWESINQDSLRLYNIDAFDVPEMPPNEIRATYWRYKSSDTGAASVDGGIQVTPKGIYLQYNYLDYFTKVTINLK